MEIFKGIWNDSGFQYQNTQVVQNKNKNSFMK